MRLEAKLRKLPPLDRRKAKRTPLHHSLYLDYHRSDNNESGSARGEDLSPQGLCFASSSELPPNTPLDLTLRLSPYYGINKSVQACARVIHCEKKPPHIHYRVGAVFEPLSDPFRSEINAFLHWLKAEYSKAVCV